MTVFSFMGACFLQCWWITVVCFIIFQIKRTVQRVRFHSMFQILPENTEMYEKCISWVLLLCCMCSGTMETDSLKYAHLLGIRLFLCFPSHSLSNVNEAVCMNSVCDKETLISFLFASIAAVTKSRPPSTKWPETELLSTHSNTCICCWDNMFFSPNCWLSLSQRKIISNKNTISRTNCCTLENTSLRHSTPVDTVLYTSGLLILYDKGFFIAFLGFSWAFSSFSSSPSSSSSSSSSSSFSILSFFLMLLTGFWLGWGW